MDGLAEGSLKQLCSAALDVSGFEPCPSPIELRDRLHLVFRSPGSETPNLAVLCLTDPQDGGLARVESFCQAAAHAQLRKGMVVTGRSFPPELTDYLSQMHIEAVDGAALREGLAALPAFEQQRLFQSAFPRQGEYGKPATSSNPVPAWPQTRSPDAPGKRRPKSRAIPVVMAILALSLLLVGGITGVRYLLVSIAARDTPAPPDQVADFRPEEPPAPRDPQPDRPAEAPSPQTGPAGTQAPGDRQPQSPERAQLEEALLAHYHREHEARMRLVAQRIAFEANSAIAARARILTDDTTTPKDIIATLREGGTFPKGSPREGQSYGLGGETADLADEAARFLVVESGQIQLTDKPWLELEPDPSRHPELANLDNLTDNELRAQLEAADERARRMRTITAVQNAELLAGISLAAEAAGLRLIPPAVASVDEAIEAVIEGATVEDPDSAFHGQEFRGPRISHERRQEAKEFLSLLDGQLVVGPAQ